MDGNKSRSIDSAACFKPLAIRRDWMKCDTRFSAVDALRVGLVHEITAASGTTLTRASRLDE